MDTCSRCKKEYADLIKGSHLILSGNAPFEICETCRVAVFVLGKDWNYLKKQGRPRRFASDKERNSFWGKERYKKVKALKLAETNK